MSRAIAAMLFAMLGAPILGAHGPHVRPLSSRVANAITFLDRRSPTFARLLMRLQASDVIVHLVEQKNGCDGGVPSCLILLGASGGYRYVRVLIQSMQPYDALLPEIAHELQHAVDIAANARAVDARSSVAVCNLTGWGTTDRCETRTAQDVAHQVLAEVRGAAALRHE